jgi:hypothetical protein
VQAKVEVVARVSAPIRVAMPMRRNMGVTSSVKFCARLPRDA